MIIALTGTNSFALKERLDELVNSFVAEHGELALERIDAEESELQVIVDALQSLPFLSARKMVVVRSLGSNKQTAEMVEQILSSIPESTDLIIYEPVTDKRTVYYKTIKAKTKLEQYNNLEPNELAGWLVEQAKAKGAELSYGNANYLVDRVGPNQAMLSNELEKLTLYDISVSRESIDLLVEPTPQSKIFELLDAAFGGNKQRALKLYEEQRAQRVEPQAILAMMAWQLQILALAKYAGKRPAAAVASDAGLNPYPVTKAMNLSSQLSEAKLKNMVSDALDIDYRGKTTAIDMDEALKTYIITL
jgi:DNA polymerase III delta subunit